MRALEIDGVDEQLSADGTAQVFVELGEGVDAEGKDWGLSSAEEVEHFEGLVFDDMFFFV